MGRLDYRMLAAALCTLSACAHHPRHAQQPADTAYDRPPAANYSSPSASQSRSGQGSDKAAQEPEAGAQAAPPDTLAEESNSAASSPGSSSGSDSGPRPHHLAAAGPGVSAGMPVETEAGSPLGFVVDVLPGAGGTAESGYVVIVGGSDATTPVPYGAARSMVRDGSVVIDHARFASAPKVKQSQIEDPSATAWKAKADSFWGKGSSAHHKDPSDEGRGSSEAPQRSDSDLDRSAESDLPPPPPQSLAPQPL